MTRTVTRGPAEQRFSTMARRYATEARALISTGCLLLGLAVVPAAHRAFAVAGMITLAGWFVWYAIRTVRIGDEWLTAVDVALVCLAALGQRWTQPATAGADGIDWTLAVVTITAVAMPWYMSMAAASAAMLLVVAADIAGGWIVANQADMPRLLQAGFVIPQAALSAACFAMLQRASRRADALIEQQAHERQSRAVNAARRADEREHQALLHDTVAATLLMVGLGTVPTGRTWLREQAHRDLFVLRGRTVPTAPTDLVELLTTAMLRSRLRVRLDPPDPPHLKLPPSLAAAVAGGVGEALYNIARHAGVHEATIRVSLDPPQVEISDQGRGFQPTQVSSHRRGLAESIVARMAAAGGRASVHSAPGAGTRVRLEWPVE